MTRTQKSMIVAGVMSGTSADGVDVALIRVTPTQHEARPRLKLLGHYAVGYPRALRKMLLAVMDGASSTAADLARLHWRLGEVYGDAVCAAQQQIGRKASLVGIHGQTVYHQGASQPYLGRPLRCTWQIGEASEVAERTGLPVISDFRPSDMAARGQAAPLVPAFDRVFFAHTTRNRVLQNLGGIANLSVLPAASDEVLAFDSGPANVMIDGCMERLFSRNFDRNGAVARRGEVLQAVVDAMLRQPWFAAAPPKSCGREQFGGAAVDRFIAQCRRLGATDADCVATATALAAESILASYRRFVWPFLGTRAPMALATDYIVAGGGALNPVLMGHLRAGLEPLGVRVRAADDLGVPSQAKEAMAFALLAWLRWHGLPGNVPDATGAARSVPLGRVTLP